MSIYFVLNGNYGNLIYGMIWNIRSIYGSSEQRWQGCYWPWYWIPHSVNVKLGRELFSSLTAWLSCPLLLLSTSSFHLIPSSPPLNVCPFLIIYSWSVLLSASSYMQCEKQREREREREREKYVGHKNIPIMQCLGRGVSKVSTAA